MTSFSDSSYTQKKILIIEDSPTIAQHAIQLLTQAGYQVFHAKDWLEANNIVFDPKRKLDLILVDINLGLTITGEKIAEIYKSRSNTKNLSQVGIYLFSNIDEAKLEVLVKKTGVDGYIPKKKGLVGLVDKIQTILKKT